VRDLKRLQAYDRQTLLEALENDLAAEPTRPTRNRKLLVGLTPPWTSDLPVWELRVSEYRIFYDVSEKDKVIYVRAVRRKPPGKTTREIL